VYPSIDYRGKKENHHSKKGGQQKRKKLSKGVKSSLECTSTVWTLSKEKTGKGKCQKRKKGRPEGGGKAASSPGAGWEGNLKNQTTVPQAIGLVPPVINTREGAGGTDRERGLAERII